MVSSTNKWSREELEEAWARYQDKVVEVGKTWDWAGYANVFTEDATYHEHALGDMTGREVDYIAEAHACGHLAGDGPFTYRCHAWLEQQTGCHKALLTPSCTAALEMMALLLDIEEGDEVIHFLKRNLLSTEDPRYETPRHPRRRVARGITAKSWKFNTVA